MSCLIEHACEGTKIGAKRYRPHCQQLDELFQTDKARCLDILRGGDVMNGIQVKVYEYKARDMIKAIKMHLTKTIFKVYLKNVFRAQMAELEIGKKHADYIMKLMTQFMFESEDSMK